MGRGWIQPSRYTRSQAHMNAAMIVMQDPAAESVLEIPLAQRDEKI